MGRWCSGCLRWKSRKSMTARSSSARIAREAGERTKVAVYSKDPDVDCVGACVGMKGMRVQSIIRELRGEKIDIIEYNEDPRESSRPTRSARPRSTTSPSSMPSRSTWKSSWTIRSCRWPSARRGRTFAWRRSCWAGTIDIKSEEEKRQEIESQMAPMALRGAPVSELGGPGREDAAESCATTASKPSSNWRK